MFEINGVPTRYFELKTPEGRVLHIEPPKLKTLNRLSNWYKRKGLDVRETCELVSIIISKNREQYRVKADIIMEWLDPDQLAAFLGEFLDWVNGVRKNDPN